MKAAAGHEPQSGVKCACARETTAPMSSWQGSSQHHVPVQYLCMRARNHSPMARLTTSPYLCQQCNCSRMIYAAGCAIGLASYSICKKGELVQPQLFRATPHLSHTLLNHFHTTRTFDNHSHRAGVPRLELAPIMGSLPRSLWPHDVVVWVRSSAQGSVRRRRIPQGSTTTNRGEVDPKT